MMNLLLGTITFVGTFIGGYVIGYNVIVRYNEYKCDKLFKDEIVRATSKIWNKNL